MDAFDDALVFAVTVLKASAPMTTLSVNTATEAAALQNRLRAFAGRGSMSTGAGIDARVGGVVVFARARSNTVVTPFEGVSAEQW